MSDLINIILWQRDRRHTLYNVITLIGEERVGLRHCERVNKEQKGVRNAEMRVPI